MIILITLNKKLEMNNTIDIEKEENSIVKRALDSNRTDTIVQDLASNDT